MQNIAAVADHHHRHIGRMRRASGVKRAEPQQTKNVCPEENGLQTTNAPLLLISHAVEGVPSATASGRKRNEPPCTTASGTGTAEDSTMPPKNAPLIL